MTTPITTIVNMDYQNERKKRETQMKTQINQKLEESGERERLKEVLRCKLRECGWRDQLKEQCRDLVARQGLSNVTIDSLVQEITPKGRALVPDYIKKELLQQIKEFIEKTS